MEILLIFDNEIDVLSIKKLIKKTPLTIYLFSLSSNFLMLDALLQQLNSLPLINVVFLDSAELINEEVTLMQKRVHEWSHSLSTQKICGKELKEWFLFPDQSASAWWLGLIAEKNTVQDSVFFKMAQINAIKKELSKKPFTSCWLSVLDKQKCNIIINTAKSMAVKTHLLKTKHKMPISMKQRLITHLNQNAILAACLNLFIWLKDSLYARMTLQNFRKRLLEAANRAFTFVTYFPNLDEVKAADGIFVNHYASALQHELENKNIAVTWLAMPVFYNGHRFKSAVNFANKFIAAGENLFLLQEFFTIKIFIQSIFWWLRSAVLSEFLLHIMPRQSLHATITHKENLPYLIYIWRHSFIGASGIRGIIFYLTFQHFFKSIKSLNVCLYFCEMQSWEKALNMAKKKHKPHTKTLAFQHTVVMRNFFNYFYSKKDLAQQGKNTDMPLPDILIANGRLPYQLFARNEYPHLREAEAIRQLYLNKTLAKENLNMQDGISGCDLKSSFKDHATMNEDFDTKHILLIAGSCDRQETKSLLTMVYSAFPRAQSFAIWFKGSPVNPILPLFRELNIDIKANGYHVYDNEPLDNLLANTTVALVANTTVAIEAAAFGCEVIIPLLADTMLMNPIIETNVLYHFASTPLRLKACVLNKIFAQEKKAMNKEVIKEYWHIDPNLIRWKELLTDANIYSF